MPGDLRTRDGRRLLATGVTPRVGFLHTSQVHVATFDALLAARAPQVERVHVVREDLLADARRLGTSGVAADVSAALRELVAREVDVVCCTCSTLGGLAEQQHLPVPVVRVDRPMARRAVGAGHRVAVLATVPSTVGPTTALLRDEAARQLRPVELTTRVLDQAWLLWEAGEVAGYESCIASAAQQLRGSCDVVVLAQASMAGALDLLPDGDVPVLASPSTAVDHLVSVLGAPRPGL